MEVTRYTLVMLICCLAFSEAVYQIATKPPSICGKQSGCHKLAHCIPQHYSFKCVCMPGFFGNGQFCTRFPTCTRNPCPAGSTCLPGFLGGFRCVCNFGFYRVGRTCVSSLSCQFRCGRPYNPLFPCQCDPKCALLGLCCQDFQLQCPQVILAQPPTQKIHYAQQHAPLHPHKPIHHAAVTQKPTFFTHPVVHKPSYIHTTPVMPHYPQHQVKHRSPGNYAQKPHKQFSSNQHGNFISHGAHHPQPEYQPAIPGFAIPQNQQNQQLGVEPATQPIFQQSPGEQATFVQPPVVV